MNRPLLFLDFDDVICLNEPYGGYDVLESLGQVQRREKSVGDFEEIWTNLFNPRAKKNLRLLHDEFNPIYVLSTSWANFMNMAAISATLGSSGLAFVAENLHEEWETPKGYSELRAHQIRNWLNKHPEFAGRWVILDDEQSGTGLKDWIKPIDEKYLILCDVDIGLTDHEYQLVRVGFVARSKS